MKTIQYFFFVALATVLMAADCSNKDSEFYNDVFVIAPDIIDDKSFAQEGQTIKIDVTIPRFLRVESMSNLLDIYKTTGGATKLVFSYELEKENTDGTWDFIEFTSENLATTAGESEVGSFVVGRCVYNPDTDFYDYQADIQALAPGNYRLSFGYNSFDTNLIEFRSESVGNNLSVNIDCPANSPDMLILDGEGYYRFTVNE
jgi:hypothetical protein